MDYIWVVSLKSGGYCGFDGLTEDVELRFFFEDDYIKWKKGQKRYFRNRKDAEDYVRPIAKKAFECLLSDWAANAFDEDKEEITKRIKSCTDRGLKEVHLEDLDKDDFYYYDEPKTLFAVFTAWRDNRDGQDFASVQGIEIH